MEKPPPPSARDIDPAQLIKIGGAVDRVRVSLRFFGETLVPIELTRLLECEPTSSQAKGDVIPDERYHRVATTGAWLLKGEGADLEEQVIALLARVTDDLAIWKRLTSAFKADVFCGVFLEGFNRGFALSPEVTRMLAARHLTIDFDIYALREINEDRNA